MRIYLFIAAVAGGVTYLLTPLIRHIAIEIGAVGEVRARDVHTVPTPRMGGLGMLIGFTVAMLFASRIPFIEGLFAQSHQAWVILAGAIMISLLGMADGKSFRLQAGQALFVGSGVLHGNRAVEENGLIHQISIVFDPSVVGGASGSVFWQKYLGPVLCAPECRC